MTKSLRSNNGKYQLMRMRDGNVVVSDTIGKPVWSSRTNGNEGGVLVVQDDGNLVVDGPQEKGLWASNTVQICRSAWRRSSRSVVASLEALPGSLAAAMQWSGSELVDQITLTSNTPRSSNPLIFWLREVAAMRRAA